MLYFDTLPRRLVGLAIDQLTKGLGFVVLAFYDKEPMLVNSVGDTNAESSCRAVKHLDVAAMPWDMTLNDPNLKHLGISRKNLRTDPETGERTFLSLILPQATPTEGRGPQEKRPVVEEAYVIARSLTGPHGTMYPGAYFWRAAQIAHDPFGSHWGGMSLMRFVGGKHVNIWTEEEASFSYDTTYNPILRHGFSKYKDQSWAPPTEY